MINSVFVALANRSTGFPVEELNVYQSFTPAIEEPVAGIRSILTGDSWDMALFLSEAMCFDPYVSLMCPPGIISYDGTLTEKQAGGVTGASLIANAAGPALVASAEVYMSTSAFPTITCAYGTDHSLTLTAPGKIDYARVSAYNNGMNLSVEWPDWTGISGDIALEASYGPSTAFSITVPGKYPYEDVTVRLEAFTGFFDLLTQTDLVDAYYFADNSKYKVCVAALAVYKTFMSLQSAE